MAENFKSDRKPTQPAPLSPPSVSLPKGGGAIRGLGEKFAANPVTGTGSLTVPIYTSPGRSGFGPQLALSYDSGAGNGPFGFGWSLSLPAITRKTDKGLPFYRDHEESDVFVLSGAEDLVPELKSDGQKFVDTFTAPGYSIYRYRPRVEGLFARIERWTHRQTGEMHWRSISRDNITTLYGADNNSRIFDPTDPDAEHPTRIFSWLICASYDDKGNAATYEYKAENSDRVELFQAHERNRTHPSRAANRYIKRIKYGNQVSRLVQPDLSLGEWMFEVVFDYGEHLQPLPDDELGFERVQATAVESEEPIWGLRADPFSTYRAGFEIRTYRRCQRVLMFHHFRHEPVGIDCLVRSTDFDYAESPITRFSFLRQVTQSGYVRQAEHIFRKRSVPPLEFEYTQPIRQDVREIDPESLDHLPMGLNDGSQWVDLDGEGISGILTEQADGWFYKRNLSPGNEVEEDGTRRVAACFGPVELIALKPASALASGRHQFIDLAGDGQVDLVEMDDPMRGFYERTSDAAWAPFRQFASWPNVDVGDPNLKFVDLTGDGHTDILITENEAITWHPSLAEDGFGRASRRTVAVDEEKGPKLVLGDGTQAIYFADLSGDGLADLVRIRNGEVCYWPNLGYGQFGSKVTMDDAPLFDAPEQFDQRRIRLIDVDGSGPTDIVYLRRNSVQVYFNLSGNRWSVAQTMPFPRVDDTAAVQAVDLLGNGTACLVWSSSLPGDARRQMRYLDLMGVKPHLLTRVVNNLGAETVVRYEPSTRFYLADKAAGTPWVTRLPFPVHVVERVETFDRISRNWFVTRYVYHHGYFDGVEREFRGFGMVEQFDTEELDILKRDSSARLGESTNIDAASHVPPTWTKTWFHTGALVDREHISTAFAGEYYREPSLSDDEANARLLDDTVWPDPVAVEEEREACRALKGLTLRQEVYANDDTDRAANPYRVLERNYTIERVQPRGANRHAVFFAHPRETLEYHYERDPADPRVNHSLVLQVDNYGNVCKTLAIAYGRRPGRSPFQDNDDDREKQEQPLISYTEEDFTDAVDDIDHPDDYRTPLTAETRTYELTGFDPAVDAVRFGFGDFVDKAADGEEGFTPVRAAEEIDYSKAADRSKKQKRLVERVRTVYRANDLTTCLRVRALQSRALPCESYRQCLTPGLFELYAPKIAAAGVQAVLHDEGKYVDLDGDNRFWIPAGRVFFHPDPAVGADLELTEAIAHFFLPRRYRDPFGNNTVVNYDGPAAGLEPRYDLLLTRTRDALENEVQSENDYRVLQPRRVTDANGNQIEVAFDTLGMVVGTAVRGKFGEGDSLADFRPDLSQVEIDRFFAVPRLASTSAAEPPATPLLQGATTRIVYDVNRYRLRAEPVYVVAVARETHLSDLVNGARSKIQVSFSYSDGFGREIQKKIQAEPLLDAEGPGVDPRWVGSGWTIYNNKGKPVRKYEPFFSSTHRFQFGRTVGVSATLFYDPLERVVVTLHPNDTYEKVVFGPWKQETWDTNDTVRLDPRTDPNVSGFVVRYFAAEPPEWATWLEQRIDPQNPPEDRPPLAPEHAAAVRALRHAGTPAAAHFDALGRAFLTVADNGFAEDGTSQQYVTRVALDIEGNQRAITDDFRREVVRYEYDMLGARIRQVGMDGATRWVVNDGEGAPLRAWDSRDHVIRTVYDRLRRPTHVYLRTGDGAETLVERTVYGEAHADAALNCRGRPYQRYDPAGVVAYERYDFKGNLLRSSRTLARDYRNSVDWSALADLTEIVEIDGAAAASLEPEVFTSRTWFDALNRPVQFQAPHGSLSDRFDLTRPSYNDANLLERLDVWLGQDVEPDELVQIETANLGAVRNIDYNAKGQRRLIAYGNGVTTTYQYDDQTFRLTNLRTLRANTVLQDLSYTYDPVGNITHIRDDADIQNAIYFRNQRVDPSADYVYDALYRLLSAKGREHLGQNPDGTLSTPVQPGLTDAPRTGHLHPGDGNAVGRYTERYRYDEVGNILRMIHEAGAAGTWSRRYSYAANSNRLLATSLPGDAADVYSDIYEHDAHGNMTRTPNLSAMEWDYKDQLHATQQQVYNGGPGERTYYVYDAAGQRVRKVTDYAASNGSLPRKKNERLYLGGFEVYRAYGEGGNVPSLERETLHVMDDKQRVALIDTRKRGHDGSPARLTRYQFGNHLGSVLLELDGAADIISYEEYYPYGGTSYQAVRNDVEVNSKRYRFTGKERDEESGFYYHGARYYAPWLGRWTSCDPAGFVDGTNLYGYVQNRPVNLVDPAGTQSYADVQAWHSKSRDQTVGRLQKEFEELEVPHPYIFSPTPDEEARGELTSPLGWAEDLAVSVANVPHRLATTLLEASQVDQQAVRANPAQAAMESAEAIAGLSAVAADVATIAAPGASRGARGLAEGVARMARTEAPRAVAAARTAASRIVEAGRRARSWASTGTGRLRSAEHWFEQAPRRAREIQGQLGPSDLVWREAVAVTSNPVGSIRVVTFNHEQAYRAFAEGRLRLRLGERLGRPPVRLEGNWVHAEPLGIRSAQDRGVVEGVTASRPLGCENCQDWIGLEAPDFLHLNPR